MCNEKRKGLFTGLLISGIAFLVYANSLENGFVWDDTNVIVTNPALLSSSLSLFKGIDIGRDYELLPYYRPLTILTFLIEERLHGLNPSLMHLVNILLHAANAFLVYRLSMLLIKNQYAALLAGFLFALHPINTEAVDFISGGRNTMLACFFILTAYLLHYRSVIREGIFYAIAGALCFLGGMFSKESAIVVLPFIIAQEISLLRYDVPGSKLRSVTRLFPYVAAASCYLIMRWITLSNLGIQKYIIPGLGSGKLEGFYKIPELYARLIDNLYIIPRYLLTVIRPTALSLRYIVPEYLQSVIVPVVAAWLCIIGILVWLLTRGRSRTTLFGIAWLAIFYLPVSGIVWFPSAPMADRYIYISSIGLWLIVADQAVRLFPSKETARKISVALGAVLLIVLAALTVRRNMDWKSNVALFSRFVEQYPENLFAHAGLGEAYFNRNREDENDLRLAEQEFEKVLALKPELPPGIHTRLGYIRLALGDSEGAVHYYTIALGIYPLDKEALLNRAIALENLGRQDEALSDFKLFLNTPGYELAEARPYAEARIRALTR